MKSRSASKIKLTSYDDLIGGAVLKDDIQEIPIGQLRDFVNHPFHVNDDDEMNELVKNIAFSNPSLPRKHFHHIVPHIRLYSFDIMIPLNEILWKLNIHIL